MTINNDTPAFADFEGTLISQIKKPAGMSDDEFRKIIKRATETITPTIRKEQS